MKSEDGLLRTVLFPMQTGTLSVRMRANIAEDLVYLWGTTTWHPAVPGSWAQSVTEVSAIPGTWLSAHLVGRLLDRIADVRISRRTGRDIEAEIAELMAHVGFVLEIATESVRLVAARAGRAYAHRPRD